MEIRTNYKNDKALRESFCALANKVFGLDLASWYENGFWQDDYIPYSVIEDGRVVANVSVNICNMKWRSRVHHLAQLGTVMTDPEYRDRGYGRLLMEKVTADCDRMFEGTYLYAEEHMREYYEKFGFGQVSEYRCRKKVNITNKPSIEKVPMSSKEDWNKMVDIIQRKQQYGQRIMVNNPGLFMFYLTGPMSDCVYYIPSSETYVVANKDNGSLTLFAIFSDEKASLGEVISSFGSGIKNVTLSFTPENNTGFELKKITDDESVLFARGQVFEKTGERFMFPEISRA